MAVPGTGNRVFGVWRMTALNDGAEGPAMAAETAEAASVIMNTDASRTAANLRKLRFMFFLLE